LKRFLPIIMQRLPNCIRRSTGAVFLALMLFVIAAASAKSVGVLEAQVEGSSVVIYSTMKKPGGCKASVMFSYRRGDQRQMRKLECNFRVPARQHYRFCQQSNPEFIDLKIESPVAGGCE
jgi:hypothetical protein